MARCMRKRVSFKAHGKRVTFMARKGACGHPKTKAQRNIAAAGRACTGEGKVGGAKRTRCLKSWFRKH